MRDRAPIVKMSQKMRSLLLVLMAASLAACASGGDRTAPSPQVADAVDPARLEAVSDADAQRYRIGPSDKLALRVLQVPDLSFNEINVDAGGYLQLPLIGSVKAAGRTPEELAAEVANALRAQYVRDPQVMVSVTEAAGQKVTVDGAVTKPGVYEMRGRTTLLQAVAMAEGPTRIADLRSIAVFRRVNDRPTVAVFDLSQIRNGQASDPVILGEDVIVVDTSRLSARMQEFLQFLPAAASFFYYTTQN